MAGVKNDSSRTPAKAKKTGMKIVFLDFDGVIRVPIDGGWATADTYDFCQSRMKALSHVLERTGAKIVVSSDWRNFNEEDNCRKYLSPYLEPYLHEDWMTPVTGYRWKEIERWLDEHPGVDKFVAVDDLAMHFEDCGPLMRRNLVLCSSRYGIVPDILRKIEMLLN